jgi:choloylglycine hydrolase
MKNLLLSILIVLVQFSGKACSIVYYVDSVSGKIFALNNEDYWYDVKPYLKLVPGKNQEYSRLWYGWKNFAQGGINEAGLFFDVATTEKQALPSGYAPAKGNLGDRILASCKNVKEVLEYFERYKIAYEGGNFLFGDSTGTSVVISWENSRQTIYYKNQNYLIATNTSLTQCPGDSCSCWRYKAMEKEIKRLNAENKPHDIKEVGTILGKSVQVAAKNSSGRTGGTLYSTFINISDMEMICVFKYSTQTILRFNLREEFAKRKSRKVRLN